MELSPDYSSWSIDELVNRVTFLERQLKEQTLKDKSVPDTPKLSSPRKPKNSRVNREFDPSKYSTRLIALKFAYLGQRYNGLEYHPNNSTPLPTVEEELWKALNKARLVFPTPNPLLQNGELNWDGCEYSKCGRTDKGVSAFGQVLGIRVRSNRPIRPAHTVESEKDGTKESVPSNEDPSLSSLKSGHDESEPSGMQSKEEPLGVDSPPFDHTNDEISYSQVLNRLLPPDIRMLAWCATPPPDFSARFSCRERQYKYFFTQPAFTATPGYGSSQSRPGTAPSTGQRREGWLDIDAMRKAAQKFIGLHDFRNFCKIDASKQITNFERRIFHADIEYLDPLHHPLGSIGSQDSIQRSDSTVDAQPSVPTVYAFTLHGSAFLWHQVRHTAAILFLIGQGLEPPSLVDDLLDISKTPCKPQYEMADDAPLVLWDCIFPKEGSSTREDSMEWIYVGDHSDVGSKGKRSGDGRYGIGGLVDEMWKVWRGRKIDEVLAGTLLDAIIAQGNGGPRNRDESNEEGWENRSQKVFQGGDGPKMAGRYTPVMERPKMESAEAINAKYAARKGFESREEVREQGFRRIGADRTDGKDVLVE